MELAELVDDVADEDAIAGEEESVPMVMTSWFCSRTVSYGTNCERLKMRRVRSLVSTTVML